jgi:hypothetical protein
MPHVVIELSGMNLEVQVDGTPVLETGLDLTGSIVIELIDLIELLEEASDGLVEVIDLDQ